MGLTELIKVLQTAERLLGNVEVTTQTASGLTEDGPYTFEIRAVMTRFDQNNGPQLIIITEE